MRRAALLVAFLMSAAFACGSSSSDSGSADAGGDAGAAPDDDAMASDDAASETSPDASDAMDSSSDASVGRPLDAGHASDAGDASVTTDAASDAATSDASTLAGPDIHGCWITHTDSGETQIDIDLTTPSNDVMVYESQNLPMTSVSYSQSDFNFDVDFSPVGGDACHVDFTSISATAMSGTSLCDGGRTQVITADRTCS